MRNVKNSYTEMADAEIEKLLTDEMFIEQQMLDLKKAQFEAYKKLIPIKKVVELKVTERAFNKMLMEKITREKTRHTGITRRKIIILFIIAHGFCLANSYFSIQIQLIMKKIFSVTFFMCIRYFCIFSS